eukprot:2966369-Pyramimonas_sp.AAC.1
MPCECRAPAQKPLAPTRREGVTTAGGPATASRQRASLHAAEPSGNPGGTPQNVPNLLVPWPSLSSAAFGSQEEATPP